MKKGIYEKRQNEDDYIYDEVKDQANRIVIEHEDPDEATIDIHGIRLKKKIVHRKSEEYNGADLYIEVQEKKFVLVQFKLQNANRYNFDLGQLQKLEAFCKYLLNNGDCPFYCSAFVWLIDDSGYYPKHRIIRLCELIKILNGRKSAATPELNSRSITRSTFKDLLVKCWAGAPFQRKPSNEMLYDYASETQRLLVQFTVENI